MPPVKTKNTEQETEIISLIKKNLLFDKSTKQSKLGQAKLDKLKEMPSEHNNVAPGLEVKGESASNAASKKSKKEPLEKLQPTCTKKPSSVKAASRATASVVGSSVKGDTGARKEKNDLLASYFNNKK